MKKQIGFLLLLALCRSPAYSQFMPPNVTGGGPPGAQQSGVGLRILPGALSCWTASPKPGAASGCAPFSTECDPYPPSGVGDSTSQALFVCRYLGGDPAHFGARPASGGAEGSFVYAAPALASAFTTRAALPGWAEWLPGNWSGWPTDRERTDLEFLAGSGAWINANWQPVETQGGSPEQPIRVALTDCSLWAGESRYFVRAHAKTRRPQYWDQSACKPGEVTYSPARKDPDYGVQLPAYPQVFGPPAQGQGKPDPLPEPQPDPLPCAVTESECRPFLDPLRLQLDASRAQLEMLTDRFAILGEQVARMQTLPADLAEKLQGVGTWNTVGAEQRAVLQDLAKWVTWADVTVPNDVRAILEDALSWQKVPPVGGRRVRLLRLEDWLTGFVKATRA
ncbi:MAG TPA: hypothetical protein VMW27_21300 [Thermoanaerobaculia bacterium]|nr:hypothetical protein [Thermoanaerobaculia bacterium]